MRARLLRALFTEMAPAAEAKGITLALDTPPLLPPIAGSLNHMRVVRRNLLDNALKYTPAGGRVTCHLELVGDHLQATVADDGRGIDPADLPHLFERFYRADKARARDIQGTGLGLSLVRAIVEAYGGRITVESAGVEQGTTVTVCWPRGPETND